MCLPSLGTEPGDIGQAAGREVIEEASNVLTVGHWSAHCFFLLCDLV